MELTDVLYYSKEKGKRLKARDCPILSTFLFSRHDFYVVERKGKYDFCISVNGELVSLCRCTQKGTTLGEAMSRFRSGFLKNAITDEMIDAYVIHPEQFFKKRKIIQKETKQK